MGGFSESVKKAKFMTKIYLSDNVEWSSKNLWKMTSADVCMYVCKIYLTLVKNIIIAKSSIYNTNLNLKVS